MKPVRIQNWPIEMLDHQIMLIERRARIWARVFNGHEIDYLTGKYASLVIERLTR